jgi:magnesium transporter
VRNILHVYIFYGQCLSIDWVAHGILDSIVDSFFPYLEDVDEEVLRMEDLVFSEGDSGGNENAKAGGAGLSTQPQPVPLDLEKVVCGIPKEKSEHDPEAPRRVFRLFPGLRRIRQWRHFIQSILESMSLVRRSKSISTAITLRRLAKTRRLVTSLTRLLATKSEVIAQIRKRLLTPNHTGIGFGENVAEDIDVAIYLGDVQGMSYELQIGKDLICRHSCTPDHILSIQHSLSHYERILSQLHPKYLSQLGINVARIKSGSDKAIMTLSIISIGILCLMVPIGQFGFLEAGTE